MKNHSYMQEALAEAHKAAAMGEVPVGAVVVFEGRVIARAHNEVELLADATAHAEVLAIRRASRELGNWRLSGASLFVTLEPCAMCIGAILLSRLGELHFGAADHRQGAVGSVFDLSAHPGLGQQVSVVSGVLETESSQLLKAFFEDRRQQK